MARAARSISGRAPRPGRRRGRRGPWSLAVVVAMLAVGREGLETALFLWAATQAATRRDRARPPRRCSARASASLIAALLGYLIYRGALRINLTRFFTWTGAFLIVVAGRRPRVRGARPAGGRHPARPEQPGVRRVRTHPADVAGTAPCSRAIFNFSPATTGWKRPSGSLYVVPTLTLFSDHDVQRRHTPLGRPGRRGSLLEEMTMLGLKTGAPTSGSPRGVALTSSCARSGRPTARCLHRQLDRLAVTRATSADPRALSVQRHRLPPAPCRRRQRPSGTCRSR